MDQIQTKRKYRISLYANQADYFKIRERYERSPCQSFSSYTRKMLLQQTVLIKEHNLTADEWLTAMLELKAELEVVSKTFQDAVALLQSAPDNTELANFAAQLTGTQQLVAEKIEQILSTAIEIHEIWSQK